MYKKDAIISLPNPLKWQYNYINTSPSSEEIQIYHPQNALRLAPRVGYNSPEEDTDSESDCS